MKIVSQCREQARRVYYGAVFEAKKEIPAKSWWFPQSSEGVAKKCPRRKN
jgi:hypothetical protein